MSLPPFEWSLPRPDGRYHPADAYHRASLLLDASSPLEAIEVLGPAIEAEPESAALRTLRAYAYFLTAQLQRAEGELAVLVELNPTDLWARYALGRALERQSRYAEALPHFRLAAVMSGDPEHESGLLRIERKLAETGQIPYDHLA